MRSILGYISGVMSGVIISCGFTAFSDRQGTVGGEVLIIPLIILLFTYGITVGKEIGYKRAKSPKVYIQGQYTEDDVQNICTNIERHMKGS